MGRPARGMDRQIMSKRKVMIDSLPGRFGGLACFSGTRVPVRNLFEYVEVGHTLTEFLEDFPRVSAAQAQFALDEAKASLERAFGPPGAG